MNGAPHIARNIGPSEDRPNWKWYQPSSHGRPSSRLWGPWRAEKKGPKKKSKGRARGWGPVGSRGPGFLPPPRAGGRPPPPPPGGHFFGQFWGLFFQARAPTAAHCARLAAWRSTSFLVGILCLADRQNSLPFLLWAQPPVPQKTSKNIPCCAVQNESLFFLQLLAYCSTLCST